MQNGYSFPKEEKLCGPIRIKHLYATGRHFTCWPLRVTWLSLSIDSINSIETSSSPTSSTSSTSPASLVSPASPVSVLIWAPKALFKRANRRNRLRRLMREAWRLNAEPLRQVCADKQIRLRVAFNYIAKEELPYTDITRAMQKALARLSAC